ncbi:tetratricopeptide repeat protein [Myxococcus xanthus]|uniref:tetratricopeptide repeat protein n=1 Tax=Myxococcus xanthus TaxID=34 RepID=UPI00191715D1|nr:tetratricopeptide repeat protein [Myxococcus xanthus]QQR47174.1 tetratricopeptide repeat protein [Myxococcus xanthus]
MSDFREEGDDALNALVLPLDEGAGPARRISRERSARMVLTALEAGALVAPPAPRPRGKRPPMWLMAGALLVAGGAAAAVWNFTRSSRASTSQVELAALTVPPRLGTESPRSGSGAVDVAPSRLDVVSDEAPPETPVVPAASIAEAEGAAEPARPREPLASVKSAAPEDLLLKANELRSEGRWKEAEALYLRVIRAEPSSLASYVARVASGSLRLEHLGDARGALRQFKAALRVQPRGVLDQEAQHGIAEAHRVLGNRDAERSALESFLSTHPDSPLVPSARARVRELTVP